MRCKLTERGPPAAPADRIVRRARADEAGQLGSQGVAVTFARLGDVIVVGRAMLSLADQDIWSARYDRIDGAPVSEVT